MRTFRINDDYEVVCRSENIRYGFRHLASLMHKGYEVEKAKACYYNRTWERYEFESVIEAVLRKTSAISDDDKKAFFARNRGEDLERVNNMFGTLKAVAAMGEIMHDGDLSAQNSWKKRMMSASLGAEGLSFPDDWDELSDEEKKERLDKALSVTVKGDAA